MNPAKLEESLKKLTIEQLRERLNESRQAPHFSAKSLLDIGIGGSNVAQLGHPDKWLRDTFRARNRSLQPNTTSPKVYANVGRANEYQKYNLKLLQFRDVQMKYARFKEMK